MANAIQDGGQAFPMPASETSQGGHFEQTGMSLRDWFAGQALVAIGTWLPIPSKAPYHHSPDLKSDEAIIARAEWAYRQADAMIAARSTHSPETQDR